MKRSTPLAIVGCGVAVVALGACAGMTPQQSDRLKEAQDIANRTTKLYGVPRVSVFSYESMSPNVAAGYAAHQGWILMRRSTLDDPVFLPVLTHELGHVTLRHDYDVSVGGGGRSPTMAAYWRARQQRELDANARAVEIMVRVLDKTEPEAVTCLRTTWSARTPPGMGERLVSHWPTCIPAISSWISSFDSLGSGPEM